MSPVFRLRAPHADECAVLADVQIDACRRFGKDYVTKPLDEDGFSHHLAAGDLQAAVDERDRVCGYSEAHGIENDLYLHLFFVRNACGGVGIGKLLIQQLRARAETTKRRAITLITGGSAPWNVPYYEKAGFYVLSDAMPAYLKEYLERSKKRFSPDSPMVKSCPLILPRVAMERLIP